MDTFQITIGADQRRLNIVPQDKQGAYKIYAADLNDELVNSDTPDPDSFPVDNLLGTIDVRSEKDFTFEGPGAFSGDELLGIAAQLIIHDSPDQSKHTV
jgi:hypothetical protein